MVPLVKEHYDVVVIGAGPAGSVAAYLSAQQGLDVLLLDKARFPRFKVCGCCLNARVLRTFKDLGLGGLIDELEARPLSRLQVHAPGRSASFDLSGGVSVSRQRLDAALVNRASQAGACFVDGTSATMGPAGAATRSVDLRLSDGTTDQVRAAVVVVADGLAGTALRGHRELAGRVARGSRVGLGTIVDASPQDYQDGAVILACGRGGYVGAVRVEDGRLDVAAALDADRVRAAGGPSRAVADVLEGAGLASIPGLQEGSWRGTPALTRRRNVVAGERFLVLGDAAGYVEPFTGEGISWAIDAASAGSEWIRTAAARWDASLVGSWTRQHRTVVRRRQRGCRIVAAVLRRPWQTRAMIGLCGRVPVLARSLVRHLTQPPVAPVGVSGR
jgi:flavin-dependent dehydrogenase